MSLTPDKIIALACKYWNGSHVVDCNNKDVLTGKFVRTAKVVRLTNDKRFVPVHEYGRLIGYVEL